MSGVRFGTLKLKGKGNLSRTKSPPPHLSASISLTIINTTLLLFKIKMHELSKVLKVFFLPIENYSAYAELNIIL